MKTLKDIKKEMYKNMKDRYNDFLLYEEKYIVENLESVDECLEDWNNTSSEMKQVRYDNDYEKFKKDFFDKNPDFKIIQYTEDEACDIVCQSLDGLCMTDAENACWEAGYIRGYEVALREFKNTLQTDYDTHSENINDAIDGLDCLLTN